MPDVLCISAGTYTADDQPSIAFEAFYEDVLSTFPTSCSSPLPATTGSTRPLWPAAFDWAVGVGALGADETNLAWFSNFGPWVDVYALGEGLINAFPTGSYSYIEPPKRPAVQTFTGMARWGRDLVLRSARGGTGRRAHAADGRAGPGRRGRAARAGAPGPRTRRPARDRRPGYSI